MFFCQVACVARTPGKGAALASEIGPTARGFDCDVTDPAALGAVFSSVEADMGAIDMLCYNAGSGVWKTYEDVTHDEFEMSWRINTFGLLSAAKLVGPKMAARGSGVIAITGATASLRGKPFTSAFASAKAAQRSLAQSLAKDLGPKGVHVFYAIIDGQVDLPRTRANAAATKTDDDFLSPAAVAQTYWDMAQQPKSCFGFEVDVRPHSEPF